MGGFGSFGKGRTSWSPSLWCNRAELPEWIEDTRLSVLNAAFGTWEGSDGLLLRQAARSPGSVRREDPSHLRLGSNIQISKERRNERT